MTVSFLSFSGCPNAGATLENLRSAIHVLGLQLEPELIEVDPDNFDRPFPGSPSVLVDGVDIYTGEKPDSFAFSCRTFEIDGTRTGVLPVSFLRNRLERFSSASV